MDMQEVKELQRIAKVAALKYARRCWWRMNMDDVQQEALAAVLSARKSYDASTGVPFGAYAYRAALLAIRPLLLKEGAPVSEKWHRLSTLGGIGTKELRDIYTHDYPDQESRLDDARWREAVFRKALHLDDSGGLGLEVLLGEEKPGTVAAAHGVPIRQVYRAASSLRNKMREDYRLWQLMRERR